MINEETMTERMQEVAKTNGEYTVEEMEFCLREMKKTTVDMLKGIKADFEEMEIIRTGIKGTEMLYDQMIARVKHGD